MRNNGDATRPENRIELFGRVLDSTDLDSFLSGADLGLGNYTRDEFYSLQETYRKHLYGEAAFGDGRLVDRARSEVKYQLAKEKWDSLPQEERDEVESRRAWFDREGEELYRKRIREGVTEATPAEEAELREITNELRELERRTGIDGELVDIFGLMLLMRREGSRGIDAHVVDAVTGRSREIKDETSDKTKKRLGIRR